MSDLRLLVAASDPLARAGLAALLTGRPGFRLAGQIDIGDSILDELDVFQPDVILWDLGWTPEQSLVLLDELSSDEFKVVAMVNDFETASSAWSAGVNGILYRDAAAERLLAAIAAVAEGLSVIEPDFASDLLDAGSVDIPEPVEDLTPRELEVLRLLAEGLSNRAIAQHLEISEHTVKFHVNAIMKKVGAQSRTAAVVQATRLGLIAL